MSSPQPSVAIVIPCYRQQHFLARAIESALEQSVPAAEIIVVDDGNDEELSNFARAYPMISLIRQANRGLAGARNSGLRAATSEKVIFLDADDLLCPNAIRAGLDCFAESPGSAFVYGGYIEEGGAFPRELFMPARGRVDLLRLNCVAMIASAMFDRELLLRYGGFDESLAMCEDWDAYLRLSRSHAFATHPNTVAHYILHEQNMSKDVGELKRWMAVVRTKERDRGLVGDELRSWRQGGKAVHAIYPESTLGGLLKRAFRKLQCSVGARDFVPPGTVDRPIRQSPERRP